jgi:hypothetical protein
MLALPQHLLRLFIPLQKHQQASASTTNSSAPSINTHIQFILHPLRSRNFMSQSAYKMSGASAYLQKMRKAELVELADSVDFKE